jgi:hypothetical protein
MLVGRVLAKTKNQCGHYLNNELSLPCPWEDRSEHSQPVNTHISQKSLHLGENSYGIATTAGLHARIQDVITVLNSDSNNALGKQG